MSVYTDADLGTYVTASETATIFSGGTGTGSEDLSHMHYGYGLGCGYGYGNGYGLGFESPVLSQAHHDGNVGDGYRYGLGYGHGHGSKGVGGRGPVRNSNTESNPDHVVHVHASDAYAYETPQASPIPLQQKKSMGGAGVGDMAAAGAGMNTSFDDESHASDQVVMLMPPMNDGIDDVDIESPTIPRNISFQLVEYTSLRDLMMPGGAGGNANTNTNANICANHYAADNSNENDNRKSCIRGEMKKVQLNRHWVDASTNEISPMTFLHDTYSSSLSISCSLSERDQPTTTCTSNTSNSDSNDNSKKEDGVIDKDVRDQHQGPRIMSKDVDEDMAEEDIIGDESECETNEHDSTIAAAAADSNQLSLDATDVNMKVNVNEKDAYYDENISEGELESEIHKYITKDLQVGTITNLFRKEKAEEVECKCSIM